MASPIDKKLLTHFAELSRIMLSPDEERRLLKDGQKIVEYFENLQSLDTSNIKPMAGGTTRMNALRDDEASIPVEADDPKKLFPEEREGFLKIPPVFDK